LLQINHIKYAINIETVNSICISHKVQCTTAADAAADDGDVERQLAQCFSIFHSIIPWPKATLAADVVRTNNERYLHIHQNMASMLQLYATVK